MFKKIIKNLSLKNILDNNEKISFGLLIIWILLPVVMTFVVVYFYLNGMLPTLEEIEAAGLLEADHHYVIEIETYGKIFNYLGAFTFIYNLILIVLDYKAIFTKDNFKNKPWFFLFLAFMLWSIIPFALSDNPYRYFTGEGTFNAGYSTYFVFAAIFTLASTIKSEDYKKKLIRLYGYVVIYLCVIMIIRESGNELIAYIFPQHRAVVFEQFNHFGYVLCMCLLSFAGMYLYDDTSKLRKIFYLIATAFITYSLIFNDTFGSYLASLIALPIIYVIYYFKNKSIKAKALIPVIIFVLLSTLSCAKLLPGANGLGKNLTQFGTDITNIAEDNEDAASAGTGRLTLWKDTIAKIIESPIVGYGPSGLRDDNKITNNDSPHNEYLSIAAETGIPGLILYLSAIITLAINKFKNLNRQTNMVMALSCIVIVYMFSALFGNALFNSYCFFMIFLGLLVNDPIINVNYEKFIVDIHKKTDKKRVAILSLVIIIIGAFAGYKAYGYLEYDSEKKYELADLEAMRLADNFAKARYKSENIELNKIYYFDAENYEFIESKADLKAYGNGTEIEGDTLDDFNQEYKTNYEYDDSLDYTNKIIQIKLTLVDDEPNTEVNWLELD